MPDTSSVAGSYTMIDYARQYSGAYQCAVGTMVLGSNGTYTQLFTVNSNGAIQRNVQLSGNFTVAADGTFTTTSSQSRDTFTGRISSTGDIVLAQTTVKGSVPGFPDNNAPEIVLGVRNAGSFSNASVAGDYTMVDYAHQYSGAYQCATGTMTLNSNGTYAQVLTVNSNGVIQRNVQLNGTYSIAADGTFTTTSAQSGDTFTGRISATGEIVLAQTTVKGSVPAFPDNNTPEIVVGVKNGGTFSTASVAGTYTAIDYAHQYDGTFQSAVGTLTLDAAGTYAQIFTVNTDGVIRSNLQLSGRYTVGADGTLTTTSSQSGDTFTGRISSAGEIVLAQTTVKGSVPGFPDNNAPEIVVALRTGNINTLTGTSGNDALYAGGGVDTLTGLGGADVLDGGAGIDTAVYSTVRASYTVTRTATGFTVLDKTGAEGTDTLANVERLKFSDTRLALDISGNAGTTAKILGAVFGRASVGTKEYVGIGLGLLDGGMSYADLMQLALNAKLGAGASNAAVVNLLYTNLVGSAPGAGDLALYKGLLDSGTLTQAGLGVIAADHTLNLAAINLVGLAGTGIEFI